MPYRYGHKEQGKRYCLTGMALAAAAVLLANAAGPALLPGLGQFAASSGRPLLQSVCTCPDSGSAAPAILDAQAPASASLPCAPVIRTAYAR